MSKRLTKWFPEDGPQPELPGVYEVDPDRLSPWYSYWDGSVWGWLSCSLDEAVLMRESSKYPRCKWRGLAENPEAARTAAQSSTDQQG